MTVNQAFARAFRQFMERDVEPKLVEEFVYVSGYTVTANGDIIGSDGKPFTGTVSSEHQRIAAARKLKGRAS